MDDRVDDFSRDVVITNELGMHARSAAKIVEIAKHAESEVRLVRDDEEVDAKSVIDILTLACAKGSKIKIRIENRSDMKILNNIVELIKTGFGE